MHQFQAMENTLELANRTRFNMPPAGPFSHEHYMEMLKTAHTGNFSDAKLGRWLGWMQAGVSYSNSFGDPGMAQVWLEKMKGINKSCA